MRKCKIWKLKVGYTADQMFWISICNVVKWKSQMLHVVLHFVVGLAFGIPASIFFGLGFEVRDGEINRIEGFNIFPDLFFRTLGTILGGIPRFYLMYALFQCSWEYEWAWKLIK